MGAFQSKQRHTCGVCGAIRQQRFMHLVRETAKRKYWECLDCDSNRKGVTFNGIPYGALKIEFKNKPSQ